MNFKFIPVLLIVLSVTYIKTQNPIIQTKFTADPPDHSRDATTGEHAAGNHIN